MPTCTDMARFEDLPNEILLEIVKYIASAEDLAIFVRVWTQVRDVSSSRKSTTWTSTHLLANRRLVDSFIDSFVDSISHIRQDSFDNR